MHHLSGIPSRPILTKTQEAALWACYQCFLRRWREDDGNWRREDGMDEYPGHAHEDVRFLAKLGFVEMMPVGAFITDLGSDYLLMYGAGAGQPLGILSVATR